MTDPRPSASLDQLDARLELDVARAQSVLDRTLTELAVQLTPAEVLAEFSIDMGKLRERPGNI